DERSTEDGPGDVGVPTQRPRVYSLEGGESFRREIVVCDEVNEALFQSPHGAEEPIAQSYGAGRDGIEHRLDVGRRAGDHAQDLRGGRLLLERLAKLAVPALELREQPHVLDRDDSLVGEGLKERDLLGVEWPRLATSDGDQTDYRVLAKHRHRQQASITSRPSHPA